MTAGPLTIAVVGGVAFTAFITGVITQALGLGPKFLDNWLQGRRERDKEVRDERRKAAEKLIEEIKALKRMPPWPPMPEATDWHQELDDRLDDITNLRTQLPPDHPAQGRLQVLEDALHWVFRKEMHYVHGEDVVRDVLGTDARRALSAWLGGSPVREPSEMARDMSETLEFFRKKYQEKLLALRKTIATCVSAANMPPEEMLAIIKRRRLEKKWDRGMQEVEIVFPSAGEGSTPPEEARKEPPA